tara:strand:- start:4473 stop:5201 length:729 start_codon:yes stop_codon:yes gene_type:complete
MSQSNECIDYLERANDCTYPSILRKNCNEYFYLDRRDNKFKKCRKSASKSKNCRDPFNDPEPSKLSGTSICKDQDDAKKRKEQHDKEKAEYMETVRLETIRQQELREEDAKNKRREVVQYIKKYVKNLNDESANKFVEHNEQDKHFKQALDKYLQVVKRPEMDKPSNKTPPKSTIKKAIESKEDLEEPQPDFPEVKTFGMNASDYGGGRKRKSRKNRKKSRKPRKSRKSRKARKRKSRKSKK